MGYFFAHWDWVHHIMQVDVLGFANNCHMCLLWSGHVKEYMIILSIVSDPLIDIRSTQFLLIQFFGFQHLQKETLASLTANGHLIGAC